MNKSTLPLDRARELSWKTFGRQITFYLPGMFIFNNMRGLYPAVSISGSDCALMCDHCMGKILSGMTPAKTPRRLIEHCTDLEAKGMIGVLISGGCDTKGRLPWEPFIHAVRTIKETTSLLVSVHTGFVNHDQAQDLKKAGVDQALIDVIGDEETYRKIYHLKNGPKKLEESLHAISESGIDMIPHIVCGIDYGRIRGEFKAVSLLSRFMPKQLVVVSLMRLPGTSMSQSRSPEAGEVARVIADARMKLPKTRISLGCARQRGNEELEVMAVQAGVNSMALPSDAAVRQAEAYGLEIAYQKTCCSVPGYFSGPEWPMETIK